MKKLIELAIVFVLMAIAAFGIYKGSSQIDNLVEAQEIPISSIQSKANDYEAKSKSNQTPPNQRVQDARQAQQLHQRANHDKKFRAREWKLFVKYFGWIVPAIAFIAFMTFDNDNGTIYVNQN